MNSSMNPLNEGEHDFLDFQIFYKSIFAFTVSLI